MLKTILLGSLAAITALTLSANGRSGRAPAASADTTDVIVIGCEFIASYVDGDPTDALNDNDVARSCGGTIGGAVQTLKHDAPTSPNDQSIVGLASVIGNGDGVLTAADFRGGIVDENWDDNQISTDCSDTILAQGAYGTTVAQLNAGRACTLDVFVFVNDEASVRLDLPSGLASIENGTTDFICDRDAVNDADLLKIGAILVDPPVGTKDNDCADATDPAKGFDNNGDGVVVFHIIVDNAKAGEAKIVHVIQEDVVQDFTVNVVGPANQIDLKLAETLVETNVKTANVLRCIGDKSDKTISNRGVPGRDVTDPATIAAPTSSLAWATVTDKDDTLLTRVPVTFVVTPPEDSEIVRLGIGNPLALVTGNTQFTRDPSDLSAATASYVVVCGGKETGAAKIDAVINSLQGPILSSADHQTQTITVGGPPKEVALSVDHSTIKCDGTETATVTAKITDNAGNNVADGVPVDFSVVALGTAKPARGVTNDGIATTSVTSFSAPSEGLVVGVTSGDAAFAAPIQSSIRVDCALALGVAPPLPAAGNAGAGAAPARTGVRAPDTGSGGGGAVRGLPGWPALALLAAAMMLAGACAASKRG